MADEADPGNLLAAKNVDSRTGISPWTLVGLICNLERKYSIEVVRSEYERISRSNDL